MITCLPYDAGTLAVKVAVGTPPGCEEMYWREIDFEEQVGVERIGELNQAMRDAVGTVDLEPWPEPMPKMAWVDYTERYEAIGDTGIRFNLYAWDRGSDPMSDPAIHPIWIAPACAAYFDFDDPEPEVTREEARITRELGWREVQSRAADPTAWYRLDTRNEAAGLCDLNEPMLVTWDHLEGAQYRLELPDNELFAPFDLREGTDWYQVWPDDWSEMLSEDDANEWLSLRNGGRYTLYLRPRRWRYVATVLAHYIYITPFFTLPNDEMFIRSAWDRPPFYPARHDIIHTSQVTDLFNFWGEARSYDIGIDNQFTHSENAAEIRSDVVGAQYWISICLAYILLNTEDADLTIWAWPPRAGDVVLGIGRVDNYSGEESRVWVQQRGDVSTEATYPKRVLGQFIVPFRTDWTP